MNEVYYLRQGCPAMDLVVILMMNIIIYVGGVSPARISGNGMLNDFGCDYF